MQRLTIFHPHGLLRGDMGGKKIKFYGICAKTKITGRDSNPALHRLELA